MIVDDYDLFLAVDEQGDSVDSALVDLFRNKARFNQLRELSKRSQSCEEVAITNTTLANVIPARTVFEHAYIFLNFRCSHPSICKSCWCQMRFLVFAE